MKRIIALLSFAVLGAFNVQAQHIRIGPEIGLSFNKLDVHDYMYDDDYDMKLGLRLGGIVDVPLGRMASFQPGVFFASKGTKQRYITNADNNLIAHVEQKYDINYLEIPLNFEFKFGPPYRSQFFIGGGPYIAFAIGGEVEYDRVLTFQNGVFVSHEQNDYELEIGDNPARDDVKGTDAGLNLNMGVQCRSGLFVRGNLGLGLSNIIPGGDDYYSAKNFGLGLSIGYLFGR
jgi:hypothetical protein